MGQRQSVVFGLLLNLRMSTPLSHVPQYSALLAARLGKYIGAVFP